MAVGTGAGVEIFTNDGTGHFTRTTTLTGMGFPYHLKLADFNGDGLADVLVGTGQQVAIVLNNGDGTFGGPIIKNIGVDVGDVYPADFNGDGKLDVVAAIPGGAAVLFNTGTAGVLGDPTLYNHSASASRGPSRIWQATTSTGSGRSSAAARGI